MNTIQLNLDLWLEVGSTGGPDRNRVYGISNITGEDLQAGRSVLIVRTSQSGLS
jgi:hypothetical protein